MKQVFAIFTIIILVMIFPLNVFATSPAPLQPSPTLEVVKPQLQPVQDEAVEYAFNKHAYVVPAEFHFYAFLDFVKAYGEANWTEEEDFQYYVQPVIDASVLPESMQGLDANIYMAYVDYGFMKVGGYFDSAGNLLGGEYVKFSSQMDSLVDAFIDQLVDDNYFPDGIEEDLNIMTFGNCTPTTQSMYALSNRPSTGQHGLISQYALENLTSDTYIYVLKMPPYNSSNQYDYNVVAITRGIKNISFKYKYRYCDSSSGDYDNMIQKFNIQDFQHSTTNSSNFKILDSGFCLYNLFSFNDYYKFSNFNVFSPYTVYKDFSTYQEFFQYFKDNISKLTKGGIKFFPNGNTDIGVVGGQVLKGDSLAPYNNPIRDNLGAPLIIPTNPIPNPLPLVTPITPPAPTIIDDPAPSPSAPGSPTIPIQETNPDLAPFMFDLSEKFPFCVPFDLIKAFKILSKPAVAPSFEWTMNVSSIDLHYTFKLDMAPFEPVAKILRITIIISFIISLIVITRNIISG